MDTSKIIKGVVGNGRYTVTAPIVKEDYGLQLQIEGVDLPSSYQVDFSNSENSGTSITMVGNSNKVRIPTELIETGKDIFAFLYVVGSGYGRTVYKFRIPNKLRPDRTNIAPTPEEQSTIDQAINALNEAVEQTQDAQQAIEDMSVSATTLAEGSSATVTKTESEGVVHLEFGIPKGQTGDTPAITASKTGKTTSIYVDGSEVAQIDDGYSPTASVSKSGKTATITITDKNGTTTAQVSDGEDGTTGATPNLTIGTVETLEPTESATATITGTPKNPVLNLGIPQGRTGEVSQAEFDEVADDVSDLKEDLNAMPSIATPEEGDADLYVCDKDGNVLAKFEGGHIQTKNFDSANISASEPFDTFTASGNFDVGSPLTLTVAENFKKGDEVYFHLDDGLPFYDYGAYATYYEENHVVINNHRGSNDYVRHIITGDCSSVKVVVGGTAYTSAREITLYVYRKNYDPEPKIVTVKADGTGMFTTLKSAVESITDANHVTNPYVIEVYEGTHNTLAGFTQEEINSADVGGSYTQTSMVGVKLTDGISLRGVGRCDNIILTAELDNSYSSEVRGNISTLNLQGEGSLENVTIFGKNIRYCVHDDFRAPLGSHHKRVVKRCKFNGEALAYSPYMTTYGAGMTAPRDYLITDCDFAFTIGIHSNRGYAFGCTIELNNCSGSSFALGDSADDGDAFNRVIINNCNFQRISVEHKNGASASHMIIEGVGNENTMVYDPLTTPYRLGMIDLAPTGLTVGKMVKRILGSFSLENTTDKNIAHGIVVGADNNFCYVQKCGYIAANMLNLSGLTVGDYITVDDTGSVITGGSASDAIGIVVATNSSTAFIKMLIGGAS